MAKKWKQKIGDATPVNFNQNQRRKAGRRKFDSVDSIWIEKHVISLRLDFIFCDLKEKKSRGLRECCCCWRKAITQCRQPMAAKRFYGGLNATTSTWTTQTTGRCVLTRMKWWPSTNKSSSPSIIKIPKKREKLSGLIVGIFKWISNSHNTGQMRSKAQAINNRHTHTHKSIVGTVSISLSVYVCICVLRRRGGSRSTRNEENPQKWKNNNRDPGVRGNQETNEKRRRW